MRPVMRVLVTGAAGFIGSFTTHALLDRGDEVVGLDNVNAYYDPTLKQRRLDRIAGRADSDRFSFIKADLRDREQIERVFRGGAFDRVVHLGAQAGVRHSLEHPQGYVDANVTGFLNILEACRHHGTGHLVYASTSSVYGKDVHPPFSVHRGADHPLTFYAVSKRTNELMAHAYASLFDLPCTGLRFFSVYGPWGRPDMALFIFARAILEGRPIDVFNEGRHRRDFTYIDDIVEGIVRTLDHIPAANPAFDPSSPDPASSTVPWRVYNLGNGRAIELMRYIEVLEECLGRSAKMNMLPLQQGDIAEVHADITDFSRDMGWKPTTTIEVGIPRFVDWFRDYYAI